MCKNSVSALNSIYPHDYYEVADTLSVEILKLHSRMAMGANVGMVAVENGSALSVDGSLQNHAGTM